MEKIKRTFGFIFNQLPSGKHVVRIYCSDLSFVTALLKHAADIKVIGKEL